MTEAPSVPSWALAICEGSVSTCPADVLEELMAAPECPEFGAAHHFLVGAALLAAARNALGSGDLGVQLEELAVRSSSVPGGACARWGVCGAAASCGMALSILLDNAPLRKEGWSEVQEMVSDLLGQIARAGAPRCCKRDSRIAVRGALQWFDDLLGIEFAAPAHKPACAVSGKNSACLGEGCPYFV